VSDTAEGRLRVSKKVSDTRLVSRGVGFVFLFLVVFGVFGILSAAFEK
jgi:hypothetical protein